jgi:hypothetical protein
MGVKKSALNTDKMVFKAGFCHYLPIYRSEDKLVNIRGIFRSNQHEPLV